MHVWLTLCGVFLLAANEYVYVKYRRNLCSVHCAVYARKFALCIHVLHLQMQPKCAKYFTRKFPCERSRNIDQRKNSSCDAEKISEKSKCCFGCNLKRDDCRKIRRSISRQIIDCLLEAKFFCALAAGLLYSSLRWVTKRCRLSWLINSALVYEPKCGGMGGLRGLIQWVQLGTGSPNKMGRSNSIFNLWAGPSSNTALQWHPHPLYRTRSSAAKFALLDRIKQRCEMCSYVCFLGDWDSELRSGSTSQRLAVPDTAL